MCSNNLSIVRRWFNFLNFFHPLLTFAMGLVSAPPPFTSHILYKTEFVSTVQGLISSVSTVYLWLSFSSFCKYCKWNQLHFSGCPIYYCTFCLHSPHTQIMGWNYLYPSCILHMSRHHFLTLLIITFHLPYLLLSVWVLPPLSTSWTSFYNYQSVSNQDQILYIK